MASTAELFSVLVPSLVAGGVLLCAFLAVSGSFPAVYKPRCSQYWLRDASVTAPEPRAGCLGMAWVAQVWGAFDAEHYVRTVSVDAAFFVRFLNLFGRTLVLACACYVPLAVVHRWADPVPGTSGLDRVSILNVRDGSRYLWCHVAAAWIFALAFARLLGAEMVKATELRRRHMPLCRSVMVTGLARGIRTDRDLRRFFELVYGDGSVEGALLARRTGRLAAAVRRLRSDAAALDEARAELRQTGRRPKHVAASRVRNTTRNVFCFCFRMPGRVVEYVNRLLRLRAQRNAEAAAAAAPAPLPASASDLSGASGGAAGAALDVLAAEQEAAEAAAIAAADDDVSDAGPDDGAAAGDGAASGAASGGAAPGGGGEGLTVDTIRVYEARVRKRRAEVARLQGAGMGEFEAVPAGFVTFRRLVVAASAAQSRLTSSAEVDMARGSMDASTAPEARDVRFAALDTHATAQGVSRLATFGAWAGLTFSWASLTTLIQSLTTVSSLERIFPGVTDLAEDSELFRALVEGLLPTLALAALMSLLPHVLRLMIRWGEWQPTRSAEERSLLGKLYGHLSFNVLLVTLVSDSLWKHFSDWLSDPGSIPGDLAVSLPGKAGFFMQYVLLRTFGEFPLELLQLPRLLFARAFRGLARTEADRRAAQLSSHADYGEQLAKQLLIALICLVYAAVWPPILAGGLAYSAMCGTCWRHQLAFVYRVRYDTGGMMYPSLFWSVTVGLFLANLSLVGLLVLKGAPAAAAATVPLVVLLPFYARWVFRRATAAFSPAPPLTEAAAVDLAAERRGASGADAAGADAADADAAEAAETEPLVAGLGGRADVAAALRRRRDTAEDLRDYAAMLDVRPGRLEERGILEEYGTVYLPPELLFDIDDPSGIAAVRERAFGKGAGGDSSLAPLDLARVSSGVPSGAASATGAREWGEEIVALPTLDSLGLDSLHGPGVAGSDEEEEEEEEEEAEDTRGVQRPVLRSASDSARP